MRRSRSSRLTSALNHPRDYVDELSTREILEDLSTRELSNELSDRLERRATKAKAPAPAPKVL
ncbi:hypothetical protein DFP72DRAFT_1059565 [Ephemerocybe angulata]|uniref:Uncharacterized protein n=1 Tax=Ephemerocybe angulata TaxID=980116 RepID=A0A8H6MCV4_9AGAR|nr:hypothetical protein DFP72DRAFT_1059565 [Tulosesus angulatus]